jgi:hypothetical protein
MKKSLSATFVLLQLASSIAIAGNLYNPDRSATLYGKTGFFHKNGYVRKLTATQWKVDYAGSNVTSGERLVQLATLRAANLALEKGFKYFRFTVEKKSLSCFHNESASIVPSISGTAYLSPTMVSGYQSALQFSQQQTPILAADASTDEKSTTFADWQASCFQKYPGNKIERNVAKAKMINGVTNAIVNFMFAH